MHAHPIVAPEASAPAASAFDPTRLAAANINPVTRLATGYLNHFNEPIVLLEMLPGVPDFAADILAWRRLSYHDCFMTSHFKERELALAADAVADPAARDALAQDLTPARMGDLDSTLAGWLERLFERGP
jgi:hypothetical protein